MAYGSKVQAMNVRYNHKKIVSVLSSLRCMYIGLMFLHFKDYFQRFKFHTYSFLNHSKKLKMKQIYFLLLVFFNLVLCFFLGINSLNYYIFATSFIMHLLYISFILFMYLCMCVYDFIYFLIDAPFFHIYLLFMFIYLFVLTYCLFFLGD